MVQTKPHCSFSVFDKLLQTLQTYYLTLRPSLIGSIPGGVLVVTWWILSSVQCLGLL